MTKTEFEAGTWDMRCLLLEALTRRLKEDSAGESRMAAAELSSCVNFLKQNAADAPDASFNNVFPEDDNE
ncbi:TPA: hypothetical protein ACKFMW_002413 [Enterobacter hormaechei]|jgi:hypothetical protein|uniref:Uncharacterized protein n=1 Tax=Escherichia coli TaxID=562 RepID=A0A8T6BE13_ECOLX|nr:MULTISPECIES: hypothetical protein [Enterobacteriaceae]DAI66022.1 MAG TPA: hypothetical protein [Bacteriophage sp.]DAL84335.1 MAG TPA: hypothetical protein [Caudoviricetes sp.]HAV1616203.1 hypothetical protein [Enterobacter hormaechei subsp. xiangfangensis]HCS4201326.1 hypothetical protein [Enterobacter kobei]HCU0189502.1 hypothetical protein [Citrobacter koseri]